MKFLIDADNVQLYHAGNLDVLRTFPDDCIDSCVTDPPYGLGFMNRDWDRKLPGVQAWVEILRVLKPGGHILACGGSRTYHRLTCLIEDSGFEIRDCLMWLYGSGFPKSHNVALGIDKHLGHPNRGRAIPTASNTRPDGVTKLTSNPVEKYEAHEPEAEPWIGWGTALKPAYEPIVLARKPFKGSVAANVLEHGTGALNIDGCRVSSAETVTQWEHPRGMGFSGGTDKGSCKPTENIKGRWPANIIHDGSDEVLAGFPDAPGQQARRGPEHGARPSVSCYGDYGVAQTEAEPRNDSGSAARFFYCAKASKSEREEGLLGPTQRVDDGRNTPADNAYQRGKTERLNTCPTVKPRALMRYLCRLITPPGGLILEPFAGSGSTVLAALVEGFQCIAIDQDETHADVARRRIEHALKGGV